MKSFFFVTVQNIFMYVFFYILFFGVVYQIYIKKEKYFFSMTSTSMLTLIFEPRSRFIDKVTHMGELNLS